MLNKFTVSDILRGLLLDKILTASEVKRISQLLSAPELQAGTQHPIQKIIDCEPISAERGQVLGLSFMNEWFASYCDVRLYHIDPLNIDINAITSILSYQYAAQNNILVVETKKDKVVIAVYNPIDTQLHDSLTRLLRKDIEFVFTDPIELQRYINEFYSLAKSMSQSDNDLAQEEEKENTINNFEQLVSLAKRGQLEASDHHVVQVVDWLLQYAFEQRASDIHIEPKHDRAEIRFRIDGILHYAYQVPRNVMQAIIGRVKTLARMDISEKRRPQDGRLKTRTEDGKDIELRLSTVPTALGEKLVMRIFDPMVLKRSFTELGLDNNELEIWNRLSHYTHGIILVTGPTGSGKTTTLYSTLRKLANSEVNVCTIEDPIEMIEPSFNQIQVHSSIDLSFAAGVKALLRQDPDIIMIGEIRDLATAEMAIQAALTGHLVLSTLHTNDAPSAITRLIELGVPAYLINATLLGVMAQRLIRTLCPHCKKPTDIDPQTWQEFCNGETIEIETAELAEGCIECRQTGFSGRIGLYEMMELSNELKSLISNEPDINTIRQQAEKEGLQTLRTSGAKKVALGQTNINEVVRVTPVVS